MEVTTQMTLDNFLSYYLYTQKKSLLLLRIFGIIFILLGLSDAISCFFDDPIIIDDLIIDLSFVVITILAGIFFIFGIKKLLTTSAKRSYNSNRLYASNPVFTFQFNANNFKILTTSTLGLEDCTYSYEIISHIIETESFIYIFTGTATAFIISKKQKDGDNISKIIDFLKNERKVNYIVDIPNAKR